MHSNSTLRRILFIGDSFTFGTGVEEDSTFVRRIERLLNMTTNGNVRCYNGGVQGYSPEQEYYNLIRLWDVIGPEAVCWVFFADDVRFDPREFWPDDSAPTAFDRVKVVLRKHLYVYNFFGTRLSALIRTFDPPRGTEGLEPVEAVNLIPRDEYILARWSVTKSFIVKAKEFCDSRSVPFLLVNVPDVSQVDSVRWAEKLSGLGVPIDQTNVQASVDSLSNFAKRNRITIIDVRRTTNDHTLRRTAVVLSVGSSFDKPRACCGRPHNR